MPSIAEVLGVATGELLNGEKEGAQHSDATTSIDNALQYADHSIKNKANEIQNRYAIVFTALLFLGIATCFICDLAISSGFTWSLIPISAIIYAWLSFFPTIKFGWKGIPATLIAISVLTIPFLYVLDNLINTNNSILPIGIRMTILGVVYSWIVFIVFKAIKSRRFLAAAISALLLIPLLLVANSILSKILVESIFDVWDMLIVLIILAIAIILFFVDVSMHKQAKYKNL